MSVVLPTLLFLGMYLGQSTQAQKGNLPRPRITALPGSVVPSKEPVTILCEGPGHAEAYRISKVGVPEPADRDRQIMPRRTNTLNTTEMTPGFAGLYQCSYQTGGHWSPWSDPLQLVMTGAYEKPSLSSMVGPVVALGEKVKLQCFSNFEFEMFILTGEDGVHSTQNRSSSPLDEGHWAVFPLNRVSSTQAGTYRCYGAFNGDPYVWSLPSDQLQLQVEGEEGPPTPARIPSRRPACPVAAVEFLTILITQSPDIQPGGCSSTVSSFAALPHSPSFEGKRLGLLIGAPVAAGVLILVLLLFLCCRCKAKNAGPADGQASEATDPQEVTYSQLTCSVPHQGTAGTPSLPRQTQASEYATLALR
ncbi:Leukocyte immunoglobulin-like receptor subfamily B member 4 [Camelus dromedarius]|uniref:Leukocyte immunoglobulin-like receptor subfamily B member 4 n=1 Tax=Camelus dromedarius TaxID=9838 RepID=A0A5N4DTR0_CAMDR|nr:Leukocyte immunoglobulin-like receptor subfamily B member 4 [Camelus dromedarius]